MPTPSPTPVPFPTDAQQYLDQVGTDACGGGFALHCTTKKALGDLTGLGTDAVNGVFGGAIQAMADAVTGLVTWILNATLSWWIDPPFYLGLDENKDVIDRLRGDLTYLTLAVLVGGLMVQGIRVSIQRRVDPAVQAARGLLTYAVTAGASTTGVFAATTAADAFAKWVLDASTDGQFEVRMTGVLTLSWATAGPGVTIAMGLIAFAASLVQAVLMLLREGALLILTATLVLAASGTVSRSTQGWYPRVVGWTVAMILYKPAAALVYAAAFTLVGEGTTSEAAFVGIAMMVLSIFALPVLMKLFTWVGGEAGGGGGSGALMSAAFAMQGLGSLLGNRGGGGGGAAGGFSPSEQASRVTTRSRPERPALPPGGTSSAPGGGGRQPPGGPGGGRRGPGGRPGGAAPAKTGAGAGAGGAAGGVAGAVVQGVRKAAGTANAAAQAGAGVMTPPGTGGPSGGAQPPPPPASPSSTSPPPSSPPAAPAPPGSPPPAGPRGRRPARPARSEGGGG